MTTGITAALANSWINGITGTIYAKLHVGDPGSAGTANAAGNTTRQAVTFASASGGSAASSADTTWTSVSTTETYTHVSYWTASSGGTFEGSCPLTSSVAVTSGNDFKLPSGQLTIALTPIAA